jgi:hypothetical protein
MASVMMKTLNSLDVNVVLKTVVVISCVQNQDGELIKNLV